MEPTERLPSHYGRIKPGKDKMTGLVEPVGPERIWSRRKGCHHTLGDDHGADGKAATTQWKKCGVNRKRWSQQFGTVWRYWNRYTGLQWDAINLRPYIYSVNSLAVSRQVCLSSGLDHGPRDCVYIHQCWNLFQWTVCIVIIALRMV